ncbi:MAG: hypothetical protein Alis3KO_29730 [Aliiglaciecola sp.]
MVKQSFDLGARLRIKTGEVIIISRFFKQLVAEVRRREITSVIVTYAVAGWLILQVAGLTFEPLGLPDWSVRVLIVITIAGFPAVFFLAWLIDFNSKGLMFDLPLWRGENFNQTPEQKKSGKAVAILMCALVMAGTWWLVVFLLDTLPQPDKKPEVVKESKFPANSIAVLAFENFDGVAGTDYFSAGLAEEILNYLASIEELNVAARTSSFRFQGEQVDIREVALLLNVKHVMEGSARREGDRIRVTVQLIDGEKGYRTWSKTFDRTLNDIFAVQQEIASSVVNELKIALSVNSENQLKETPTDNIEAYIFYMQGREKFRSSRDADVMNTAKQLFNQALEIDPSFARAYAGICETNLRLYQISNAIDDFESAEQACDQAQKLNKGLNSDVKVALGRLYRYRGWYQKAKDELYAAIKLSPTAVDAFIELGEVFVEEKAFSDAEAAFMRAVDLKRNYWKAHEAIANYYYVREQFADSANSYEIVTRLTPDSALGFGGLGAAYWMMGETQKALDAYERSLQLKPTRQAYTNIGTSYYYAGQFEKAAEMQMQALALAPDDHRIWGRLAESYRFIPGKEAEVQDAYSKAVEFALKNLDINNEDWLTRGQLGLYYVYLAEPDKGMKFLDNAIEQSNRYPELLYFKALASLEHGGDEASITLLEEAVAAEPYYRQFIALDPDLQQLKEQARFQKLLPSSAADPIP